MLHPQVKSVNPPSYHSYANLHFLSNPAPLPDGVPASPSFDVPSVKRDTKKEGAQKPHKSGNPSLGIYTKSCNPPPSEGYQKIQKLKVTARQITGHKRLHACGHDVIPGASTVKIYKGESNYSFGGLQRCGSVWMCPSCASKITEARREELKVSDKWLSDGHGLSHLVLTVPHSKHDDLEELLEGITDAFRRFTNRPSFKRFCKRNGIVGRVRAIEVTYWYDSETNGWHPHIHILFWHEKPVSKGIMEAEWFDLLEQWQSACEAAGLKTPNEHGLTWEDGSKASKYISKWGIREELTKGHLKKGKKEGHLSPFALLELASQGDEEAGKLFLEYTKVYKGKRQLVWSKGLRTLLGLDNEKTDQDLADQEPEPSKLLVMVPIDRFIFIRDNNLLYPFLHACDQGEEKAKNFLQHHCPGASPPPF